jgi:hypothetical protein
MSQLLTLEQPISMKRREVSISAFVCDFAIVLLGLSTFVYWIYFLLNASFAQYASSLYLVLPLSLAFTYFLSRGLSRPPASSTGHPKWLWQACAGAALAAASIKITNPWAFWLCLVAASSLMIWAVVRTQSDPIPTEAEASKSDFLSALPLMAACLLALAVTLIADRPAVDDDYYLSLSLTALFDPEVSLRLIKGVRGARALTNYQVFAAAFSFNSGIPFLTCYYLILPTIWALASVLAFYRLCYELSNRAAAAIAILVLTVCLILWGDVHRSPGNWSFVRLFLGKSVFVSICVPAMLTYALRYYSTLDIRYVWLLSVGLIASMGAIQTVIVLAPLLLVSLSPFLLPRISRSVLNWKSGTRIDVASALRDGIPLAPLLIPFVFAFIILSVKKQGAQALDTNIISSVAVAYTAGTDLRAMVAFGCLILLPIYARADIRLPLAFMVALMLVFMLNPLLGDQIDWVNSAATWRILWLIPLAPAIAVVLSQMSLDISRYSSLVAVLFVIASLGLFAVSGQTTLSAKNGTTLGWPGLKLMHEDKIYLRPLKKTIPVINGKACMEAERCY